MKRLDVVEAIVDCTACPLHLEVDLPTPFMGPVPSDVMILSEQPYGQKPYTGEAGEFLAGALRELDRDPESIPTMGLVSCATDTRVTSAHTAACQEHRDAQLEVASPKWVLLLGHAAAKTYHASIKLDRHHGVAFTDGGRIYVPTYDPQSFVARRPSAKQRQNFLVDLKAFFEIVDGGPWLGAGNDLCLQCGKDSVWWEASTGLSWCEEHLPKWERLLFEENQKKINADYKATAAIYKGPHETLKKAVRRRDKNRCRYCGVRLRDGRKPNGFSLDHVMPTSRKGSNTIGNVVACCHRCNTEKADKLPGEAGMKMLTLSEIEELELQCERAGMVD